MPLLLRGPVVALCGDGNPEPGEDCDDGNTFGADGCASNCTFETSRTFVLPAPFGVGFQLATVLLPAPITGQLTLRTGGDLGSGDYPLAIANGDVAIDPGASPGLFCVCIRARQFAQFGPGNVGAGTIGCGAGGLAGTDYLFEVDHNTNDVDPSCQFGFLEFVHSGVCRGPAVTTYSGSGPPGSMTARMGFDLSILFDGGTCSVDPGDFSKGPDGIPCNADDPTGSYFGILAITTGTAEARILDRNNSLGAVLGDGQTCGSAPCLTKGTGAPLDCASFLANPNGGLDGMIPVGTIIGIDTFAGDAIALVADDVPTLPPTPTPTITRTPTITPTPRSICGATPVAGCSGSVAPGRSKLTLRRSSTAGKAAFNLKGAAAADVADFGDPTSTTDYSLCVYDQVAGVPVLVLGALAPAGGNWSPVSGRGFRYASSDLMPNGMSSIMLLAGEDGKAAVRARARGETLEDPGLPMSQSTAAIVQVVNDQGGCWGTTFSAPAIGNSDKLFVDRGD